MKFCNFPAILTLLALGTKCAFLHMFNAFPLDLAEWNKLRLHLYTEYSLQVNWRVNNHDEKRIKSASSVPSRGEVVGTGQSRRRDLATAAARLESGLYRYWPNIYTLSCLEPGLVTVHTPLWKEQCFSYPKRDIGRRYLKTCSVFVDFAIRILFIDYNMSTDRLQ